LWYSMPKRWHINATLLLFLPPIEIGGKILAGLRPAAPCGLPQAARGYAYTV